MEGQLIFCGFERPSIVKMFGPYHPKHSMDSMYLHQNPKWHFHSSRRNTPKIHAEQQMIQNIQSDFEKKE